MKGVRPKSLSYFDMAVFGVASARGMFRFRNLLFCGKYFFLFSLSKSQITEVTFAQTMLSLFPYRLGYCIVFCRKVHCINQKGGTGEDEIESMIATRPDSN